MQAPSGHLKKPQFKMHPSSLCTTESCFSLHSCTFQSLLSIQCSETVSLPFPSTLHLEGMSSIPFRQLLRETGNRKPWCWRADSVRTHDKQHPLSDEVSTSRTLRSALTAYLLHSGLTIQKTASYRKKEMFRPYLCLFHSTWFGACPHVYTSLPCSRLHTSRLPHFCGVNK